MAFGWPHMFPEKGFCDMKICCGPSQKVRYFGKQARSLLSRGSFQGPRIALCGILHRGPPCWYTTTVLSQHVGTEGDSRSWKTGSCMFRKFPSHRDISSTGNHETC